jgi:hypothetical protein
MSKIIGDALKLANDKIKVADGTYTAYALDVLRAFLFTDLANLFKYKKDCFDCDDFAFVVLGREREWFGQAEVDGGSTFGFVWGDIRKSETDTEPNPHAINFFVDDSKELWLVEPQNDTVFKPTANSTFWLAVV